jgi:hypothetical protein
MSSLFENIKQTIREFQQHLEQQMPAKEAEVDALITSKSTQANTKYLGKDKTLL